MNQETRNCQNCKNSFIIEPDDFSFYKKMKVPVPTFCPDCRRQRRLARFNLVNLFHRDCDLCKEQFISMYPNNTRYVVYCPKCWWSDKWDWRNYGLEYDFNKTFFAQWNELLHTVPLLGLSINSTTTLGSPYNNHAADLKDCYLTFYTDFNQECAYGTFLTRSRESFDSSMVMDTENCYDCMCIYKSNRVIGTRGNNRFCIDSAFLRDCENCQDCFMSANLRNKKYCFKNQELSKEEYLKKISEYDLGSYKGYISAQAEAEDFWKTVPPRPVWDTLSVNSSGSYVFHSKNCKECYDVADSEDCKYCMMLWRKPQKNCFDMSGFGYATENIYEGVTVGEFASDIKFCDESGINLMNAEYCKLAFGSSDVFGCVSVGKGKYVIFNKEYSREEYFQLKERIIVHMNEKPYVDTNGNTYKYGEFFPIELNNFGYNKTFAQLFYPADKNTILENNWGYTDDIEEKHLATKQARDLPDHITQATDSLLKETIGCQTCGKGYRIIEMELSFHKKMNVALPQTCPFCRINDKLTTWVDNMNLKNRTCDLCNKNFKTHYSKDRAPVIYCKECYLKTYF